MVLRPSALEGPTAPYRSAAFGTQPYSNRHSEPLYSFGTGSVEARASVYLGKEFCPHQTHLAVSPGPAAYSPSYARASSAPTSTSAASSSNIKWGMDTTSRSYPSLPSHNFRGTPGLGSYKTIDSTMGREFASAALTTCPKYSWTNVATREKHRNVYISPGHERELLGSFSPGPHVVGREAFDSMGQQASSMRRTMPRFAPTKALRVVKLSSADTSAWPGPAHYNF